MATYGFDDAKNKKEVYTKEEVITILQQAIDSGSTEDVDPSLAPTPAKLKEIHNNDNVAFWVGTESEFEALGANVGLFFGRIDQNKNVYIITDDSALDSIERELEAAAERDAEFIDTLNKIPHLFNDRGVRTTPTNNYSDYDGAKVGDLLINTTGLYFCRSVNEQNNYIEWLRNYDYLNEMPNFFKENSGTPSTNPADYTNVKIGDFVMTNNNILYFCNALSAQYCGWAKIIRPVDLLTKQDVLTAGDNIDITNNVISAPVAKWENVDTVEITEETQTYTYNFENKIYDDVLVVIRNLTGTTGAPLTVTANLAYWGFAQWTSNVLSATAKRVIYKFERENENIYNITTNNNINNFVPSTNPHNYNNKITKVVINTEAGKVITSATLEIYGRTRF